ncbi:MAG: PRC-barrel domain-containing protein, partial [Propionibacteriaceae bacterium]|nr:PRC-barrel domain-containing protein [Propionibacteriaceae bacterium]
MSARSASVFISRIRGLPIVDAGGDPLGTLGDVVVHVRPGNRPPKVKGIVMELFARRRVYVPME